MELELEKLKREELLKLKADIDSQINYIDNIKEDIRESMEKNCLKNLDRDDKIFCINFKGNSIYNMDYVKINFNKTGKEEDKDWVRVNASHDTKPLGCSITIREECMTNHCFLYEFPSSMYFFTLKPNSWKEDLFAEMNRCLKNKREYFNKEVIIFKHQVHALIKSSEIDTFLDNIN